MLDHLKKHCRSWLIAIVIVALALAVVWTSDAFQQCMKESYNESSDYEPEKGIAQILSTLRWTKTCAGNFFKEDGEAITATFTVVLAISTILLWIVTWKTGKRQSADMRAMADIAEKQMLIVGAQTDIQKKQHAIGRLQFFATHRPKIIVHAIEFLRVSSGDGDCVGATILCFNKGPTAAEQVVVRGEIMITEAPEIDVQRHIIKGAEKVISGQKFRFEIKSERRIQEITVRMSIGHKFFCIGTISYTDENKLFDESTMRRETGFCFVLTTDSKGGERWISAKSPEHEYEL